MMTSSDGKCLVRLLIRLSPAGPQQLSDPPIQPNKRKLGRRGLTAICRIGNATTVMRYSCLHTERVRPVVYEGISHRLSCSSPSPHGIGMGKHQVTVHSGTTRARSATKP